MPEASSRIGPPNREELFASHVNFRHAMVDDFSRQLFGPLASDGEQLQNETLIISPLQNYATGVLFPQKLIQELLETEDSSGSSEEGIDEELGDLPEAKEKEKKLKGKGGQSDQGSSSEESEPLNLANEFSPSACGISFRITELSKLKIRATYGTYASHKKHAPHPRAGESRLDGTPFPDTMQTTEYNRTAHDFVHLIDLQKPYGNHPPVIVNPVDPKLKLHLTSRPRADGTIVVSAMLVNHHESDASITPAFDKSYFQTALEITSSLGEDIFLPVDRNDGQNADDKELMSLELLYRHRRSFALGHGVSGDWNRDEKKSESGRVDRVITSALPTYDLKPIKPRERAYKKSEFELSMNYLSGENSTDKEIIAALSALAEDYLEWINDTQEISAQFDGRLKKAAISNLNNCRKCLSRMTVGIQHLKENPTTMLAFKLMNKAMAMQQFHSALPRRELDSEFPSIPKNYLELPKGKGNWRPFQLAFVLMNIAGMSSSNHPERELVDLIWFPTGGGKTEAYLGLAAFSICLERMSGVTPGVIVLMRYTLRLLTAQQFQRAAALTLSLETLRQKNAFNADLGEAEISIGLWVGESLSPNKRADAVRALGKLAKDRFKQNPFQVLQCPWCGVDFVGKDKLGYKSKVVDGQSARTVKFVCPDSACSFSTGTGLPVLVIDEDLYDRPPTLLIGTVDKFAQISWNSRVGNLFGLNIDAPPPSLIIQDELHLISGPLGSIVGLYETAIDQLCSREGHRHKIVASTATIRRAEQQCHDLYARKAFEFPPQAIRAGETYFAYEDDESPGRLYVGLMASAVRSHQTALVRACSPLLQNVCIPTEDEKEKEIIDPYGTLVWYFNSLRELGHAATLCVGDIPEFLKGLRHRQNIPIPNSRYIREIIELTSRRNAEEIPAILQQLEIPWKMKPSGRPPVDVLLATNMISVGVDISRLGLIVMSGQPKSTSEYIQATSRVGRSCPGLVVTVYTQTKSRDRSHYERFVAYHQSLYRHVEPTSVTPFSPQARERGMRGVLIALARQIAGVATPDLIERFSDEVEKQVETIVDRVTLIDQGEAEEAKLEIEDWLKFWKKFTPLEYGKMGGAVSDTTLVYPFGSIADEDFQRDSWPMLTSMRNVDGSCQARVLNIYEHEKNKEQET